jgi:hypothetical protein
MKTLVKGVCTEYRIPEVVITAMLAVEVLLVALVMVAQIHDIFHEISSHKIKVYFLFQYHYVVGHKNANLYSNFNNL